MSMTICGSNRETYNRAKGGHVVVPASHVLKRMHSDEVSNAKCTKFDWLGLYAHDFVPIAS